MTELTVSLFPIVGLPLCDLWICADVLLCTVSILHLCAIAIERCLAVSSITYLQHRSAILVLVMVVICWILSTMVSLPARFHRNRVNEIPGVIYDGDCIINQEQGYTIYSNLLAFDLPMVFMVIMYARIYCTARRHIRKQHFSKYQLNSTLKKEAMYRSQRSNDSSYKHRCCCCCGYVLETKFHKEGSMFRVGLMRCSDFQCSSSSEKRTTITEPPETMIAAAAAAMRMAATMISTTKEPGWGSSDSDSPEYDQEDQPAPKDPARQPFVSTISLASDDGPHPLEDGPMVGQPLTYETLRRLQRQRIPQSASFGSELKRDISIHTNASSLQFADDTPQQTSKSSSLYSSMIRQSDSINFRDKEQTIEEIPGPSFVPLSIYYRKQRQKRWLAQRKGIGHKARTMMKHLSMKESVSGIKPEEEKSIRARLEQKRERRAIRTLAIITGCFVLCWLPFNIHALLSPFFGRIHPVGASVLLWLGYLNSLLNPVIYTIFSKEFRSAFRRIICRGPRLSCCR